jgi:hypothetical protein
VANTFQFISTAVHSLAVFTTFAVLVVPVSCWRPIDACTGCLIFLGSLVAIVTLQLVTALALCTLHTMRARR